MEWVGLAWTGLAVRRKMVFSQSDLDVVLAELIDKVQENLGIEEHLRDDEVGTCIHLLLEIDHLLPVQYRGVRRIVKGDIS